MNKSEIHIRKGNVAATDNEHNDISSESAVSLSCKRVLWIDTAKGLAILLVLLVHSRYRDYTNINPDSWLSESLKLIVELGTPSFLALFYFLSGYTFRMKESVLASRFVRLMSPYALWCCVYIIINMIYSWGKWTINAEHFAQAFAHCVVGCLYGTFSLYPKGGSNGLQLLQYGTAPLWFLPSLFCSFLFFLQLLHHQKRRLLMFVAYLFLSILFSFSPILMPWSLHSAFIGAIFIYAGYTARDKNLFNSNFLKLLSSAVVLYLIYHTLCAFNGSINMSIRRYGEHLWLSPFLFIIIGVIGAFLFCMFSMCLEKMRLAAPFAYLGRISLLLLCCHNLVFTLISRYCANLNISGLGKTEYLFAFKILTAICFAIFIHEGKKKLKAERTT